jgi:hypothetical protein
LVAGTVGQIIPSLGIPSDLVLILGRGVEIMEVAKALGALFPQVTACLAACTAVLSKLSHRGESFRTREGHAKS